MTKKLINLLLKREREKNEDIARTSERARKAFYLEWAKAWKKHTHKRIGYYLSRLCANADRHLGRHFSFNPHDFDFCCIHGHTHDADDINMKAPLQRACASVLRELPPNYSVIYSYLPLTHTESIFNRNSASGREIDRHPSPIPSFVWRNHTHKCQINSAHGRR